MKYRKVKDLQKLPNNPRIIKDADFERLCTSIADNKEFFEARPLILSDRTGKLIIIGGNQRFEAAKKLKLKEIPTFLIEKLTEEKERELIIRDNVSNGFWDFDLLANEWDVAELADFGLNFPDMQVDVDYDLLDDDGAGSQADGLTSGVKKAIQIEFETEHYEEAQELVKFWREKKMYIGKYLLDKLRQEKDKL